MPLDDRYRTLPNREAQQFLAERINLPTDSWQDTDGDVADAFFTSAGAKGSLLNELREATDRALNEGWRPERFQQEFDRIAESWDHAGDKAWRAQLIYRQNLRNVNSIGREIYQWDPTVRRLQPYLQYQHSDALHPRPLHLALDEQVFTHDTIPFTLTNGFGCACRYISLSQRQLDERGLQPSTIRPGDQVSVETDGQTYNPVVGPERGWNRQPMADRTQTRLDTIQRVIDRSSPSIADSILTVLSGQAARQAAPPTPVEPAPPPSDYQGTPIPVLELENQIRSQRFESLAVYNAAGDQILFKDGAEAEVPVSWGELAQMRDTIVTHNHPLGWNFPADNPQHQGNSFSKDDWLLAAAGDVQEMRAVSVGHRHRLRRPDRGWPSQTELDRIIQSADRQVRARLQPPITAAMQAGDQALAQQLIDQANVTHWHEVAEIVAQQTGADYDRQPYRETPWRE